MLTLPLAILMAIGRLPSDILSVIFMSTHQRLKALAPVCEKCRVVNQRILAKGDIPEWKSLTIFKNLEHDNIFPT